MHFRKLHFSNAIFDECIFEDCDFVCINNDGFTSSSFVNAIFEGTKFLECAIKACFFTGAKFSKCIFETSKLEDIVWESAEFRNTTFDNVSISGTNIEFVKFLGGNKFIETPLPFASIPFAFGAISLLKEAENTVWITVKSEEGHPRRIDQQEYIALLPTLECFYRKTNNYFPLANLFVETQKIEEALEAIRAGVELSIAIDDPRLLRYFCLLMKNNIFDTSERKQLFYHIQRLVSTPNNLPSQRSIYTVLPSLREILFNDFDSTFASIEINTRVDYLEYDKISLLIKCIDQVITLCDDEKVAYSIELRHNCPIDFLVNVFADPASIYYISGAFYYLFGFASKLVECIGKHRKKELDGIKSGLENSFIENPVINIYGNIYNTYGDSNNFGNIESCDFDLNDEAVKSIFAD